MPRVKTRKATPEEIGALNGRFAVMLMNEQLKGESRGIKRTVGFLREEANRLLKRRDVEVKRTGVDDGYLSGHAKEIRKVANRIVADARRRGVYA